MKILVINGPNINMLGIREPDVYGKQTFSQLLELLEQIAKEENIDIIQYQSNHEGDIVDGVRSGFAALDLNGIPLAGKTGTTSSNYDRWFVGFTPYYVGAVWYGYDEVSSTTYNTSGSYKDSLTKGAKKVKFFLMGVKRQ